MKILHVIPSISLQHGGPSYAMGLLERSLSETGVEVTTVTTDDLGPGTRMPVQDLPPNINGARRLYFRKWTELYKLSPRMATWLLLNVSSFDLVHIHALFTFSSVAAAVAAIVNGVPYIVRPLGTLSEYGIRERRPVLKRLSFSLLESTILRKAASVHFTSQDELTEASKLTSHMVGVVIPLGVDDAVPINCQLASHPHSERRSLLFLSRLDPKKNVESLLKAFALISERFPNIDLVIAGDGPSDYRSKLQRLGIQLELDHRIRWLGHVVGIDKQKVWNDALVFVLPSFSENFGIAVAEALMAGVPCVVGRGVAISGAIGDASAGIVVDPDPQSIASALQRMLGNRALLETMSVNARSLGLANYSSSRMAAQLISLYEKVKRNGRSCAT